MLQSFVTCLGSISDSILGSILEQNRSQIDPQIESKMGRPAPLLEFLFAKHIFPQHDFFFGGGALLRRATFSAGAFFLVNMSNPCQGPISQHFWSPKPPLLRPFWTDFFSHWPPRPGVKKGVFLLVFIAFLLKAPQANSMTIKKWHREKDRVSAKGGVKAKPPNIAFCHTS